MRTLCVLLWKDLKIIKRQKFNICYKIFFPMMIMIIVLVGRSKRANNKSSVEMKLKEEKFLDDKITPPSCILYTPNSKLAETLMGEVGNQLGLSRLTAMPHKSPCNGYYPYTNYSEIAELVKTFYENEAVIIFEDMDAESWSSRKQERLTYTIRMDNKFNIRSFTSTGVKFPPDHPHYGDIYDDFMRIQWAVDTSYIKVLTGIKVSQKLSVQEFPHFRNNVDDAMLLKRLDWSAGCVYLVILSSVNLFEQLMTRMLCERADGIQELIKMNGGVSSTTMSIAYFINHIPPALSISIGWFLTVQIGIKPILEYANIYTFIGLALYVVSLMAFAMACSYVVNKSQFATVIAYFIIMATGALVKVIKEYLPKNWLLIMLSGMMCHVPLLWMFHEMLIFDALGKPLTFSDLNSKLNAKGSVLQAYIFLILQSLIYFALTWYLSYVRQGHYGNSLPWNFLCKKKGDGSAIVAAYREVPEERDGRYFEEPPTNKQAGIRIINVSKYYPKPALSDVSLDVYKGEITVLLGHNGAGKTTLMSIITGMTSASQGKVLVNGLETASNSLQVRRLIGFCTQHNLFIEHINVIEHVMFFNMLKGNSKDPRADSQELLNKLGIGDKATAMPEQLSGGMKRRLQLACALAGGSDVLVLDEPTSGLDVETRRELWNLLLSLRGERTVLLSTHFMEEADALGDRVAALHTGQLRCHATPMFLKKAMGGGYRLSLITSGKPNDAKITAIVTQHVSGATVREELMNTITYNLPSAETPQFPALFAAIETNRTALEINSIGVGVSTMEEVFLFLCSDSETFVKEETDTEIPDSEYGKIKGKELYKRQAIVLLKRHFNFFKESLMALALHIIAPALLIYLFTLSNNNDDNSKKSSDPRMSILMDLNIYKPLPERRAFLNINGPRASMRARDQYRDVKFASSRNINYDLFKIGKDNIQEYNKYLVGVELDDEHAKALYTTVYRHAAPVALNLLSNVIASQYLPAAGARVITTHNHPLDAYRANEPSSDAKTSDHCVFWAGLVGWVILLTNYGLHVLPSQESASGARHLHVMAGCPAALHWFTTLAVHTTLTLLTVVPIAIICTYVFDADNTFTNARFLLTLGLVIILGTTAFFGLMYLLVISFEVKSATGLFMLIFVWTGGFSLEKLFRDISGNSKGLLLPVFVLSNALPPFAMIAAIGQAAYVARLNALCELNKNRCPKMLLDDRGFDENKCCAGESKAYISFDEFAPGIQMLIMLVQAIFFMTLVILIQMGYMSCFCDRLSNRKFKAEPESHVDELVAAEVTRVDQEIELPEQQIVNHNKAMLVSHLHKKYNGICEYEQHAVRGISFSVTKGECFGLLGLNGAGKSTTFKMMTSEVCPTSGRIFANGVFLHKQKKEYLNKIGYCPQFLGIDDFQTGSDNLRTLLTIRGLDDKDIDKELKAWIAVVGLQKYANMRASSYSGGYKRRLAAAAALCSGAPLTLLDEPTAGVDVGARRLVHAALRKALSLGDSIIITSHSMDEMEALCTRIAIMAAGKIRALGTPAELRTKYAQGYALILKVKPSHDLPGDNAGKSALDNIKEAVTSSFNCELKDEHMTMLHYHIKDKMNYSDIFSQLEELRMLFPDTIEDYSVSETTLEEVFLHLAKEHLLEKQAAEEVAASEARTNKHKSKWFGRSSKV